MGTEFQFYRNKFRSLVIVTMKIDLARLNCTLTTANMIPFIVFYHKVPACSLTLTDTVRKLSGMEPCSHPLTTLRSRALRWDCVFHRKTSSFRASTGQKPSRGILVLRTNPEKRPLPMCLWTLLLQGNVNRNKIQCKTRIGQNVHAGYH